MSATEIKQKRPSIFNDYFTFAFVRNPWSWQVSLYFFMLQNEDHYQHDMVANMSGFNEYLNWRVENDKHLQKEYITGINGDIVVDFVGKLENFEEDIKKVENEVGFSNLNLPHKKQSSHSHYTEYYTPETKELVRDEFSEDIELFNYEYKT